jgi:hypothetical protein
MPVRTAARLRPTRVGAAALLVLLTALAAPAPAAAAPTPTTGAASMVVAQLHLLDLQCLAENDDGTWWGSDEVYITVNGQRVWERGSVDRGDNLLVNYYYTFDELVTVQLWEDDGGLRGGDDHMATWYVFAVELGSGVHKVRSQYTAGSYDLRYEVV